MELHFCDYYACLSDGYKTCKEKGGFIYSSSETSIELYVDLGHNFNLEEKVYPLQVWQDLAPLLYGKTNKQITKTKNRKMVTISKKGKEIFGIPKLPFAIVSDNDLEERVWRL